MKRLLVAAALLLGSACAGAGTLAPAGPTGGTAAGTPFERGEAATVLEVVDGDTIWVSADGRRTKIRLIGIDTPETRDPRVGVQCYGPEATRYARQLLDGERVTLVYDVERFDRYGRTLAYVYVDGIFVNRELVARGYAMISTFPPNVAHADEFVAVQATARGTGRGLWGAC